MLGIVTVQYGGDGGQCADMAIDMLVDMPTGGYTIYIHAWIAVVVDMAYNIAWHVHVRH